MHWIHQTMARPEEKMFETLGSTSTAPPRFRRREISLHHPKSGGNRRIKVRWQQVTTSNIHWNSRVTWVRLQNYIKGSFILIRKSPHFLRSVWPELLMELSSSHLGRYSPHFWHGGGPKCWENSITQMVDSLTRSIQDVLLDLVGK